MAVDAQLDQGSRDRPSVVPAIILCLYLAAVLVFVHGYLSTVSAWTDSLLRMVGY